MIERLKIAPWDELAERRRTDIDTVVVHRIEVSQEEPSFSDTPAEVARFFLEHPIGMKATGGAIPYPILIAEDGEVSQLVPLNRVTPHARSANATGIGVACLGDFRQREPSEAQLASLVQVCAALCSQLGLAASAVAGHDEISGSSHDPDKECPGRGLSMPALREQVEQTRVEGGADLAFAWGDGDFPA